MIKRNFAGKDSNHGGSAAICVGISVETSADSSARYTATSRKAQQPALTLLAAISLLSLSTNVSALTVTVVDQFGKPAQNAVVQIAGKNITSSDTSVAIMDQINRQYVPHVLAIHQNQQVSFPNSDNVRHHVYSFSKTKPFEMKLYAGTPNTPITFENEGVVVLGCNIHDTMLGYIVVYGEGKFGSVDDAGKISFSETQASVSNLNVWHPNLTDKNKTNYSGHLTGDEKITVTIDITPPPKRKTSKKNKFGRFYK